MEEEGERGWLGLSRSDGGGSLLGSCGVGYGPCAHSGHDWQVSMSKSCTPTRRMPLHLVGWQYRKLWDYESLKAHKSWQRLVLTSRKDEKANIDARESTVNTSFETENS